MEAVCVYEKTLICSHKGTKPNTQVKLSQAMQPKHYLNYDYYHYYYYYYYYDEDDGNNDNSSHSPQSFMTAR